MHAPVMILSISLQRQLELTACAGEPTASLTMHNVIATLNCAPGSIKALDDERVRADGDKDEVTIDDDLVNECLRVGYRNLLLLL